MTQNQLQYQANIEIARSNLAKEAETKRNNLEQLAETIRSNRAREDETHLYNQRYLDELYRSNVARETANLLQLEETKRHQRTTEELTRMSNVIQQSKVSNDYTLGLLNYGTTATESAARRELLHEQTESQRVGQKYTKADTELVGAKAAEARQHVQLMQAQTKSENDLRKAKKFQSYTSGIGSILGPIARAAVPLLK